MDILGIDELATTNIFYINSDFPTNVVPDKTTCKGELRSHSYGKTQGVSDSYESICKEVCERFDASYDFNYVQAYPLLRSTDDLKFAKLFQDCYKKIGVDSELQVIDGGPDANFYAE